MLCGELSSQLRSLANGITNLNTSCALQNVRQRIAFVIVALLLLDHIAAEANAEDAVSLPSQVTWVEKYATACLG